MATKKNNAIVSNIDIFKEKLTKAIDDSTKASKAVGDLFADAIANELFLEDECKSFSAWFQKYNDNICGIGYKQAKSLADCSTYVWKHAELANIPCGTASALVKPCKEDAAKVIALVKSGKIKATTPQKTVRKILVDEGLRKGEIVSSGAEKAKSTIGGVYAEQIAVIFTALKNAKADDRTMKAWNELLEGIEKVEI